MNYCSNNYRFADDARWYALYVIILLSIIIAFFIPEFAVYLGEFESLVYIPVTLTILTVVLILLFIKGLNVRKQLPRDS